MSASPGSRRAARAVAAVALTAAVTLSGCSGEGGSGLPTTLPSISLPDVTLPTVTLPDVTLPTITGPTVTGPTVTVTEAPPEPTTEEPATEEPTTEEPVPTPTEEATAEPEETAAADLDEGTEDPAEDEGGNAWLWLLLLVAALAAVAAVVALVRRRRARAAWSASVAEVLPEAVWLRDSVVPDLLSEGPDGRAGIWVVTRQRVVSLEEELRRLVSEAPEPSLGRPVAALTTAVEALRRLLDQADALAGFGGPSVTAALQRSRAEMDEAITAIQPPVPEDERV